MHLTNIKLPAVFSQANYINIGFAKSFQSRFVYLGQSDAGRVKCYLVDPLTILYNSISFFEKQATFPENTILCAPTIVLSVHFRGVRESAGDAGRAKYCKHLTSLQNPPPTTSLGERCNNQLATLRSGAKRKLCAGSTGGLGVVRGVVCICGGNAGEQEVWDQYAKSAIVLCNMLRYTQGEVIVSVPGSC